MSLELARQKMAEFQAQDPQRFLLHIVAAAVASGSKSISIRRTANSLELISPGSYIPEKEVLGGFEGVFTGHTTERALDLVLGLQSSFGCEVEKISLVTGGPGQDSYCWTISESEETQTRIEPKPEPQMEVRILFKKTTLKTKLKRLFRSRGSYAEMSPECRLVDSQAEFALTPITINSQPVNRKAHLPFAIVSAVIGSPPVVTNSARTLRLSGENWQGGLALKTGRLYVVVSGLCYEFPQLDGLSGVLYYQNLKLDLSRLQVIQDENFHWLMTAVRQVKQKMFFEAVKAWTLHTPEEQRELLDRLAALSARSGITESEVSDILKSYENSEVVHPEHIELCYLWARENEFNQASRHLQQICETGYRLTLRQAEKNGPSPDILEKIVYFSENGQEHRTTLEWLVEMFLSAYRRASFDTERWYRKASERLSIRFQGPAKRCIKSALDLLCARYFDRTHQVLMANHFTLVWREERKRHGEPTTLLDSEHYEAILTNFSRADETVRLVMGERVSQE